GPVTPPTGVTVYYSTESNPCRTELNYSPSGCTAPNWSLTPPNDITTVQSLKFDFGSITIAPGDSLILSWPMRAPVDAPTNDEITWNSFGYVGTRTDNNSQLLASEPIKVGIQLKPLIPAVYGNYVWLDTNQNGLQDDGQTGVSGVRVDLYKDNGDGLSNPSTDLWVGFTVTDATGQYVFPALTPGDYFAVFSPPTGYTTSPSNTGSDDAIDSDGIVTPVTHLDSGETDLTWDLGIYLSPNCDVQITSYTISPCNWDGSNSTVTVNVFVAWANAPSGENIAVTLNGNTETINVSGGATSPALVSFTMPANNTDYTINAAFNSTSSCSDIQEIHTPLPCNPNVCVLNIDAVNVSACNNGNSTLDVVLSWTGSPSAEDIIVTANGQTQTINVSGGILSPATVSFTVPADGSSNNPITAAFATTSTCSDNATYNAPTCALPCSVTVDSAVPSTCDPATNTYSLAVTVTYANPPIGDITINVGGTDYTFTPDGTSPDTYTVTGLTSNGTTAIDVSATFVGDNTCTHTLVDAYDAPVSCSGCVTSAIYLIDENAADPLATHLWSFGNYNSPTTTGTDYGRLRYMHPTLGIQEVTTTYVNDIEAMAVTPGGIAYILGTEKVSGGASHCQPLFMYDLNTATANSGNIVMTLIGHILRGPTNVSYEALLYDKITGRLYIADPVGSGQNIDTEVDILEYIDL
ncbi:MAG TPA: SdrD B-like domain-containing protein, partial [Chitinophagales bacterium]|nr:SdrD B-like domain-containing protein [Chitinophagales bacterium]